MPKKQLTLIHMKPTETAGKLLFYAKHFPVLDDAYFLVELLRGFAYKCWRLHGENFHSKTFAWIFYYVGITNRFAFIRVQHGDGKRKWETVQIS